MSGLATKITMGIATVIGLKAAGKVLPGMSSITMAASIVTSIDDSIRRQVVEDVMKLNTKPGGTEPNIILCAEFKGAGGKQFLKELVKKKGGTVWFQQSRGRVECFHHHRKDFQPKAPPRDNYDAGLGHIVHGDKDSI